VIHLNSRVLTLYINVTFLCKLRRINVYAALPRRLHDVLNVTSVELGIGIGANPLPYQLVSPGLSLASGFEHPASTLPTRFPAALGIGHG